MQKIKTVEYEVLARFLSDEPLYEVKWKNHIIITNDPAQESNLNMFWKNYTFKEMMHYYGIGRILAHAHTVRGAWKKACKVLNQSS